MIEKRPRIVRRRHGNFQGVAGFPSLLEGCWDEMGGLTGRKEKERRADIRQTPTRARGAVRGEVLGCKVRVCVACACVFGAALQRRRVCLLAGAAAKTGGGAQKSADMSRNGVWGFSKVRGARGSKANPGQQHKRSFSKFNHPTVVWRVNGRVGGREASDPERGGGREGGRGTQKPVPTDDLGPGGRPRRAGRAEVRYIL